MSAEDRKTEPPLGLDMDFGEALERFLQTSPKEVEDSVERAKRKRPPQDAPPRRPARQRREPLPGRPKQR